MNNLSRERFDAGRGAKKHAIPNQSTYFYGGVS
nr:MAG TPA: hypothetical protein [Crassvirales sp.]